jgi:hypothetical protein
MATSIGVTITFPMIFVAGRERRLPLLAGVALLLHVLVAKLAVDAFELAGAALALTISTGFVLASLLLLLSPRVLEAGVRGLLLDAGLVGGLALIAFGAADAILPAEPAAVVGALAFGAMLVAARGLGLRQAWGYLRTLE